MKYPHKANEHVSIANLNSNLTGSATSARSPSFCAVGDYLKMTVDGQLYCFPPDPPKPRDYTFLALFLLLVIVSLLQTVRLIQSHKREKKLMSKTVELKAAADALIAKLADAETNSTPDSEIQPIIQSMADAVTPPAA